MKYGYAWRDPEGTDFDLDAYRLHEVGCDPVIADDEAGASRTHRPTLNRCLAHLQMGDEFIFSSVRDLPKSDGQYALIEQAIRRGVNFYLILNGQAEPANVGFEAVLFLKRNRVMG